MPTVSYTDAMKSMVDDNPQMGVEMLEDAINALLEGNTDEGRIHLRAYINATLGFAELGRRMNKDSKNIMRSLSPKGNPTASNLMQIIQACATAQDVMIAAHVTPRQEHAPRPT